VAGAGFPAWWPTTTLGRHAVGDDPSACGAGGIRGTRAKGERERGKTTEVLKGVVEHSGNVLKTRVI
jgi:hypothetical protein